PAGASIDPQTGVFSWTPTEAQGPGVYTFKVRVTDNGNPPLYDEQEITVTVNEVNIAPVLAQIGDKSVDEKTLLTFTATATDENLPANTLTFSLEGTVPTGAAIDAATGVFSWTPTEAQGPGIYTFKVRVTDDGHPALFAEEEITVTVNEVNIAPVLAHIGDQSVDEKKLLTFTATATDENLPANTLTFSLEGTIPTGAAIDAATGVFAWTPTEAQGPGVYTFKVRVTDNGNPPLYDEQEITVTVNEVNIAPVLAQIGDKSVDEKTLLTFTATATDENLPANTLTFSLEGTVPTGAAIDVATGVFAWTPTEAQGPGVYTFKVRVTDDGHPALFAEEEITVTVNEVNIAPVLAHIGDQSVDEKKLLTFTASATDENLPANTLTFSLEGTVPTGAAIDPQTGVFAWTPTEAQGPGIYTFKVRVTDNGNPPLYDEQEITVTVNEVNIAPVMSNVPASATLTQLVAYSFNADATDEDIPAQTLTFSLVGAPSGANINSSTGVFTWTPAAENIPGNYTFMVRVSDGIANTDQSITLTVLDGIPPTVITQNITVQLDATGHATIHHSQINNGSKDNHTPDSELVFSLDKTEFECGHIGNNIVTLTVRDAAGNSASNTAIVTITKAVPIAKAKNISVTLAGGIATITAAQIDNGSSDVCGTISLSLSQTNFDYSHINKDNIVTLTVTDQYGNSSSATAKVTVTKAPPVLATIDPQFIEEESLLSFTASATDEYPLNKLTFSLVNVPEGAGIDPISGKFTWKPAKGKTGVHTFSVKVTDDFGLSALQLVYVTVTPKVVVCNILPPVISVSRNDKTFTGLDEKTITLGYGAQKLTLNTSNSATSTDFSWSPAITDLKNPNSANPEFTPSKPGVYNFTITIKDKVSGCQASNSITITVLDVICDDKNKKVSVSHKDGKSNSVLCISVNAVDAHLAHGDKLAGTGPVNAGSEKNTYYTPEGQEVLKASLSVLEPTGTQLKAYPNPFVKQSTVKFTVPNDEQRVILEVYNLNGRKIRHLYEGKAEAHQPYSFQLDGSNLPPGVYLVRLITSKGVETFRVIMTE
ncbi:MAG TPA: putative Ig domain-containing protein, partial [Daejeonella sp.]|nr:putative Ig domain-containing protein [Daejeonella sp.]